MKLTDALLGEHGVIYSLLDHVERALPAATTLNDVKPMAGLLMAAVASHAHIEDELLFPALDPHLGQAGPLAVMRHEHEEIEKALEGAANAQTFEAAVENLRRLIGTARNHFGKEEQVLFHIAQQVLSESDLERLGGRWADARRVAAG
ncbi:hemerythrin domain-containing protein [bacterium]|nr:hemerythrin domain-containing protein [bacterium]